MSDVITVTLDHAYHLTEPGQTYGTTYEPGTHTMARADVQRLVAAGYLPAEVLDQALEPEPEPEPEPEQP